MSQNQQGDTDLSDAADEPVEEQSDMHVDEDGDQDSEPPTPDGEEPDTTQLDPELAEPASHPDPDVGSA
jgi:hypothetical protein